MVMANRKVVGTDYIPQYEPNSQENLKKKLKGKEKTKREPFWLLHISPYVACIILFFAVCFSFVALNVWLNGLGHEVTNLNNQIRELKESNEKLRLNISSLSSLDRIEQSALAIGMVYPNLDDYIYLNKTEQKKMDMKKTQNPTNNKNPQNTKYENNFLEGVQSFFSNSFTKLD